jgi:tryptophan synthase alpha chain
MSALDRVFSRARDERRAALVLYLTASDPDWDTSRRLVVAALRAGADVVELGIPWSDPSADGVAIQAAMARARRAGGCLSATLKLCRSVRDEVPDAGIVLFGYANPIAVRGAEAFATDAAEAGADGVLCVDWPPEEAVALTAALRGRGLDWISLMAPTTTPERIKVIGSQASGFVYYVSLTGTTGRALGDLKEPRLRVAEIRALTAGRLPVVVGFGIATPEEAVRVAEFADGVVVGSAAVRVVADAVAQGRNPVPALTTFVSALRGALGRA